MADNELPPAAPDILPPLDEIASALAPIIFAEIAPTFGFRNGVGNVTLETVRHMTAADGNSSPSRVVVAHLRLPLPAIIHLKNAVDGMLLQAAPPASDASN